MVDHGSRADEARVARQAYVAAGVVFLLLFLRLFVVQVIEHRKYAELARENQFRVKRVIAPRGILRDRNGNSLVDNVPEYQMFVDARAVNDTTLLDLLQHDFDVDLDRFQERIALQSRRGRSHLPVRILGNLDKAQLSRFEENRERYPGAFLEARGRRRYIYHDFATHVLGYVGEVGQEKVDESTGPRAYRLGDLMGRSGVEELHEDALRGFDGRRLVQVNAAGLELFELESKAVAPTPGNDVYLTIDLPLQQAIETEFWPEGRAGAAVVMDVKTGELLAAVSKPGYDLNRFSIGISNEEYGELRDDPLTPLYNRYAMGTYPPGSTWKIVSSTALLQHGVTRIATVAEPCWGSFRVGRQVYRCHKEQGHGALPMLEGFAQSCDVYYYQYAKQLTIDGLAETARQVGFGARTGFALAESPGLVPDTPYYERTLGPRNWTWTVAVNCIIGQGEVLVTPLQMARLTAAVANGGTLLVPHITRKVVDAQGRILESAVPEIDKETIFAPSTQKFLYNAMLHVVVSRHGTAKRALPESLLVGGKTGTAETPGKKEDHAWFVFFAPWEDPQIAGAIIVEKAGHGGAVAAPIARKIVTKWFGLPDRGMSYWRRMPELQRRGLLSKETS
jgi:penicillin-binding protein 2